MYVGVSVKNGIVKKNPINYGSHKHIQTVISDRFMLNTKTLSCEINVL